MIHAAKQTLGEEYCDLVQVTALHNVPPSTKQRLLSMVLYLVLPYRLPRLVRQLSTTVPRLANAIAFIERLHLAMFFFGGTYYHMSKRVASITYVCGAPLSNCHRLHR
jgi:hypothetical protein